MVGEAIGYYHTPLGRTDTNADMTYPYGDLSHATLNPGISDRIFPLWSPKYPHESRHKDLPDAADATNMFMR
jgi:hypothetical protein